MTVGETLRNSAVSLILLVALGVMTYLYISTNLPEIIAFMESNPYLSWMVAKGWNIQAILSSAVMGIIGFIVRHVFAYATMKKKDQIISTYENILKAFGINPHQILGGAQPAQPAQPTATTAAAGALPPAVIEQLKKAGIQIPGVTQPAQAQQPTQAQPSQAQAETQAATQPAQQPSEEEKRKEWEQKLIAEAQKLLGEGRVAEAQELLRQIGQGQGGSG